MSLKWIRGAVAADRGSDPFNPQSRLDSRPASTAGLLLPASPPPPPSVKVLKAGVVGNDSTFSVGSQVMKTFCDGCCTSLSLAAK